MSGETERDVSGWTVDTLHVHIDTQFRDLVRHLDERFESQQAMVQAALVQQKEQVVTAQVAMEKRLDALNELRALVADQQRTFVSRPEYDAAHAALVEKVDALAARVDTAEGSSRQTYRLIGLGFVALTIVISIVVFAANYLTKS
jgi:hypothetical protein